MAIVAKTDIAYLELAALMSVRPMAIVAKTNIAIRTIWRFPATIVAYVRF